MKHAMQQSIHMASSIQQMPATSRILNMSMSQSNIYNPKNYVSIQSSVASTRAALRGFKDGTRSNSKVRAKSRSKSRSVSRSAAKPKPVINQMSQNQHKNHMSVDATHQPHFNHITSLQQFPKAETFTPDNDEQVIVSVKTNSDNKDRSESALQDTVLQDTIHQAHLNQIFQESEAKNYKATPWDTDDFLTINAQAQPNIEAFNQQRIMKNSMESDEFRFQSSSAKQQNVQTLDQNLDIDWAEKSQIRN